MKILILGGTGYIGKVLGQCLEENGHSIKSIGRSTKENFIIGGEFDKNILSEIELVVYLSWFYDTTHDNYEKYNLESLKEVLEACKEQKIKFMFASTTYASSCAKSRYNKTKGACEELVKSYKQQVIRFGAVYFENNSQNGFYEKLRLFSDKYKIFPKILPEKESFYKTGIDNIIFLSENIKHLEYPIFNCMESDKVTLIKIFDFQHRFIYIPVYWKVIYFTLRISEKIGIDSSFRSDSILSIWGENT